MKAILISLIFISGFISYTNSINNPFIWDDEELIVNNPLIKDYHNVPLLFQQRMNYPSPDQCNFYRPLQIFVFTIDYILGKLNVKIYHASSILFHTLVALTLYWLALLLLDNVFISFAAAILFVTHPIHTEAVTYISGLSDPLAAFFMLLAMISYIKYSRRENSPFSYALCFLSFFLGLLSKETAIIFPLLLVAYDLIYNDIRAMSLQRYAPFILLDALYIILRKTLLNFPAPNAIDTTTFFQRLPVVFHSFATYIIKLVLPLDLHMDYRYVMPSMADPRVIIGFLMMVLLIWTIVRSAQKNKPLSFLCAWFLIQYLPISNIFPLNFFFAEHWIYTPSISLFILLGWLVFEIYKNSNGPFKTLVILTLAGWVCLNSYLTIKQNQTWSTEEGFYQRILKYNPTSYRIIFLLGNVYFDKGEYDKALSNYSRVIELVPSFYPSYDNRGDCYFYKGYYDQAIGDFTKAIELNPADTNAHRSLEYIYTLKRKATLKRYPHA